jgi:hypothetical protein
LGGIVGFIEDGYLRQRGVKDVPGYMDIRPI